MAVVTVSRQYGAGGFRVARSVAEALRFRLVGREIVEEAARRIGWDPEAAKARDERAPALVEEVGMALAGAGIGGGPPVFVPPPSADDRSLARATAAVITSLAEAGEYVILGRGGQAVLKDHPAACHISLVGEIPDRARRIMESQDVDEREAIARCERVDADRAGYVRRFYGVDIRDPALYDCVLNTSRLSLDDAVAVAVVAAREKLGLM
ncbi:MAG: cytidylate kinase-like family protein [Actinomycetota bacterium]|nr:cytidylate kinase-like family protein [Actinomycetota bacterium]